MYKKLFFFYIITIAFIFNTVMPTALYAETNPDEYNPQAVIKILEKTDISNLKARSEILIDALSGNILFEKNSHERLPIASITKIMSMLLVMEAIDSKKLKLNDIVPVSEYATSMGGSQAYLAPGEQFLVSDMLKAVAIHSSNDVTVALAEKLEGSETTFVKRMNEKAKQLGMNDTNFLDCTGLTDDKHYSSAYDVALMSREIIINHPKVLEFTSIWHDTFRNGKFSLDNTNKLIKFYPGVDGLKTGFTIKAGYCLSATALRDKLRLISIVLGEPDTNTRFAETKKILDYGFLNFELYNTNKKNEKVATIDVLKGLVPNVNGVLKNDVNLSIIKTAEDKITKEINVPTSVEAPIKQGQKIGELVYKLDNSIIGKVDIVAANDVQKASWLRLLLKKILSWIGLGKLL